MRCSAKFCCKCSNSKPIRLWRTLVCVTATKLCYSCMTRVTDNMDMNKCGCVVMIFNFQKQETMRI